MACVLHKKKKNPTHHLRKEQIAGRASKEVKKRGGEGKKTSTRGKKKKKETEWVVKGEGKVGEGKDDWGGAKGSQGRFWGKEKCFPLQ